MKLILLNTEADMPPIDELVFALNDKGFLGVAKWDGMEWLSFHKPTSWFGDPSMKEGWWISMNKNNVIAWIKIC